VSLKDRFKSLIGIDEEDFFEEEIEVPNIEPPMMNTMNAAESTVAPTNVEKMEQPQQSLRAVGRQAKANKGQVAAMNANAMMSKVIIREPKDYSDARNIADCLKESLPVFVNLQRLDKGLGRQVIDFLSGTIYALDGDIKRVGNDLFLCTPRSVETDGEVTESTNNDELSLGEL